MNATRSTVTLSRFATPLVAAFCILAAQAQLVGGQTIAASPLAVGPLQPYHTLMVSAFVPDTGPAIPPGRWEDRLEQITWHGHAALQRSQANTRPGSSQFVGFQTTIFDPKTFLPYLFERRRLDGAFIRYELDGLHVTETKTSPGPATPRRIQPGTHVDTLTKTFELPEAVYEWNGGSPGMLFGAMPLADGLVGTIPIMVPDSTPLVRRLTYRVVGSEVVEGPDGKPVKAWKVTLDDPQALPTFWVTREAPFLQRYTWHQLNGRFTVGGPAQP